MTTTDYIVLLLYTLGTLAISLVASARTKSSSEMFAAGGQSPWWAAGISSFMTMFSAGTFVVWGGIAYKYGVVAIAINLCYGLAAIAVGATVASRWNKLGIRTPAEFISLRYGRKALSFYVATIMAFKIVGAAVSVYALGVIMTDAMPLTEGNFLRDPHTHNLSLPLAIVVFGGVVVFYTVVGGLWGVLMTDVLQFIVLSVSILFVVPAALGLAGGFDGILRSAPDGFLRPVGGGYTWWFLAGWVAIHYFVVGAEWAFVQRYLCVASPRDARNGCYLFGALYLVSPFIWFLPPIAYRAATPLPDQGLSPALASLNPEDAVHAGALKETGGASTGEGSARRRAKRLRSSDVTAIGETAYIRVCREVLPSGMMGMMLAAMFSATASTVSGHLNVFAGVLTNDYFARGRNAVSERQLVFAGRMFTIALGAIVVAVALSVKWLGGAERVIVAVTSFMTVPLLAPILGGLISRRLTPMAVWLTAAIAAISAVAVKFLLAPKGPLASRDGLVSVSEWLARHEATLEVGLGVALPCLVLTALHWAVRRDDPGAERAAQLPPPARSRATAEMTAELFAVVAWSLAACGAVLMSLVFVNDDRQAMLAGFALGLVLLSLLAFRAASVTRAMHKEVTHAQA